MLLDALCEFSKDQEETTVAAHDSTNIVDFNSAARDVGKGEPVRVKISIGDTAVAGTSSTVQFQVVTATDEAFTSPVVLYDSGAIAEATLVAGYNVYDGVLPVGTLQYLKIVYTIGTAVLTAGKFNANLALGTDTYVSAPDALAAP